MFDWRNRYVIAIKFNSLVKGVGQAEREEINTEFKEISQSIFDSIGSDLRNELTKNCIDKIDMSLSGVDERGFLWGIAFHPNRWLGREGEDKKQFDILVEEARSNNVIRGNFIKIFDVLVFVSCKILDYDIYLLDRLLINRAWYHQGFWDAVRGDSHRNIEIDELNKKLDGTIHERKYDVSVDDNDRVLQFLMNLKKIEPIQDEA